MHRWRVVLGALAAAAAVVICVLVAPPFAGSAPCPTGSGDPYSTAVLSDSPIAYYRLDESSGPTLCDSSSSAANGGYNGSAITYGVPGALGNSDTAVRAGRTSSGIATGGAAGISGNHSFTLEGWFRSTGTIRNQVMVDIGGSGPGHIAGLAIWTPGTVGVSGSTCTTASSKLVLDTYQSINCWGTGSVDLYDGQWHHLAITYASGSAMVTGYVDGRRLGAQRPAAINIAPSPIRVGYWIDRVVNQPYTGAADEIAVYPRALSAPRILAHYQRAGPTLGETVNVAAVSGTVRVREKGQKNFHILGANESLPVGSSVDATHGRVRLASAKKGGGTQQGVFFDGRFKVRQSRRTGLTDLRLEGGDFRSCRGTARAAGGPSRVLRRLWGHGKGRTRTSGHNGSGTVRGTFWLTEDRCDGTFFKVRQGVVVVRDFTRHRTVVLHAGEHYLAPAR